MLLLFCFDLWVRIPPKLLEQRSALLLTCSHRCGGHVPRRQWARLDSDTLELIDPSACLVELCACDRRFKRSSRSAHGCLREHHRGFLSFFLVSSRSSEWLCHVSSSSLRSSCKHTCKSRQCLFIKPEFPSRGLQLLVRPRFADKLSSSISRIIAVRSRCVRALFLAVSTHQEGRDVGHLSARLNVALAIQNTGVVNGLHQV